SAIKHRRSSPSHPRSIRWTGDAKQETSMNHRASGGSNVPDSFQDFRALRRLFPALQQQRDGQEAVYFDGPGGTQVPRQVIDAMVHYLETCNANHGGLFATSRQSD